ncbi:hypothetical protein G5B40_04330 [Pikeienuella piscinae]|uniref:Porin n=1 Tax=Pikeienuella piscinae TaxID=2748098 RepID=A0A7L5BT82_9RHOB|nr:hypothetical protein [Pikeienuella piscinae]QIE54735.1 hypothetical protein G5B40_04330 [Pikeienuella piscinae]
MNNNRNGRFRPMALSALCILPVSFVGAPQPASAQQTATEAPLGTVDSGALAKGEEAEAQATRAPSYPRLTGGVAIEVEDDYTFDSDDKTAEINDLYNTTEAALSLEFSASTSLNTTLVFEPIRDPGPNDDREFEDQGLYMEELYFRRDFGPAAALAGKYDPAFGFAWDAAPGLYGADFAEDYELTEKLGAAIEIPFELGGGDAAFTIAAYMADRTIFSDSLFSNRGNLDESDGGVSNTDAPESFVVSLAGEADGFTYNLGFRRQAEGVGDAKDEYGFVAGASAPIGGSGVEMLGEFAYFPNFDGSSDSAVYGALGLAAPVGPVTLSGVYSLRDVQHASTDHLATVSAEYEIAEGLSVGAGYRYGDEGGVESHTVGALLVYEFGF